MIIPINPIHEIELIKHLFVIFPKAQILEHQIIIVLLRDPSHNFYCSCWASLPINLVELLALGWPFYNSQKFIIMSFLLNFS